MRIKILRCSVLWGNYTHRDWGGSLDIQIPKHKITINGLGWRVKKTYVGVMLPQSIIYHEKCQVPEIRPHVELPGKEQWEMVEKLQHFLESKIPEIMKSRPPHKSPGHYLEEMQKHRINLRVPNYMSKVENAARVNARRYDGKSKNRKSTPPRQVKIDVPRDK